MIEAADGLRAEELQGTTFPNEGSVTGEVIRTGKAVALADAGADDRIAQPIVRARLGPALFIPLAVRGRILGSLTVANARGGPPLREAATQLVETFAEQAAALQNLGDKPLVVRTAGIGNDATHQASQNHFATLSTNSAHHTIQAAHEDLITNQEDAAATTQAILDVVSSVRSPRRLVR